MNTETDRHEYRDRQASIQRQTDMDTETDRHEHRDRQAWTQRQTGRQAGMLPYMFQVFVDVGVIQVEVGVAHLSQDCISLDMSANQTRDG